MEKSPIYIYCDGASKPHTTKEAGWSSVIVTDINNFQKNIPSYGYIPPPSTNNVGELLGLMYSLYTVLQLSNTMDNEFRIYTDSQYAVYGYNQWMLNWDYPFEDRTNGHIWKTMYRLKQCLTANHVNYIAGWVKGHHVSEGNHLADEFADYACKKIYNKGRFVEYAKIQAILNGYN